MRNALCVAASICGAVLLAGCGDRKPTSAAAAAERPPLRIPVIRVETRPFTTAVAITGTLVSPSTVIVKAETTGRILKFPKQEGDGVSAGEPVVWVDESHERIAVRQAESALALAEIAVERARVLQGHNRSEYARAQNLLQSGGITDRDYKAAQLADRDSEAQVGLAMAQVEHARSQLAAAKKMLQDSIVRAPVAGEIESKTAAEGGYVEPPTPVFSIVDNSRLELECLVATANLGDIRAGQQVRFTVNTFPGQTFEGRVIETSPTVQAETRSAKVRVRVDNAVRRLKAGMFVEGEIVTGLRRDAILIPAAAVYRDDGSAKSAWVFVVEGERALKRMITVGRERDSMLEVVDRLRPGDILVAEQSIQLADGVRVQPELLGSAK